MRSTNTQAVIHRQRRPGKRQHRILRAFGVISVLCGLRLHSVLISAAGSNSALKRTRLRRAAYLVR